MLAAYIDDSGSEKQGPVMVLAGYVARFTRWMNFSDEWQTALDEQPKLAYFKLKEALRLEEQFGRLRPQQRDARVFKFCSIIRKYVDFGIVSSFRWADLEAVKKEFPEEFPLEGYSVLFNGTMSGVLNGILKDDPNARLLFVFDEQGTAGHLGTRIFDRMVDSLSPDEQKAIMGVSHVDDKTVFPLQAADTLAWLMRRHAFSNPNCANDLGDWRPEKPCLEPLRSIPRYHTHYPKKRFQSIFDMYMNEKGR
jgi:hypothetical protein